MWEAYTFISKRRDPDAVMLQETEIVPESELFWERRALIVGLENFILALGVFFCNDENGRSALMVPRIL